MAKLWRHPWHLLWIAAAYLPFLGSMSVQLTGDQKVYLSTAMEMLQRDSWLRPLLFGEGSYYKPPFQYWATMVGWKIFGFGNWGAYLPSAFAVLVTAWFLGEIADCLKERRLFVNAGLWFAAALGTVTYGTTAQMEIYLCLFYAAAWWAGLKYLEDPLPARRSAWLYLAFLLAGVSAWVKSPLYSVFWVLGYLSYLLISGEWEAFRSRHLYLAWIIGAGVGASWFAYILAADGDRFWSDYVVRETWDKRGGNSGSPWSLWVALSYFCFPFTLMVFPAARTIWRSRARLPRVLAFIACWSWPPAVFFTLYPYRIKPYLYILVPVAALLVDYGYYRAGRQRFFRSMANSTGFVFFIVMAALAAVVLRAELAAPWVALGFALTGALGFAFALTDHMRALALAGLGAVFFFRVATVSLGESDIAGLRRVSEAEPTSSFAMWDETRNIWHEVGYLSSGIGKPIARLHQAAEVIAFLRQGGKLILTDAQVKDRLPALGDDLRSKGESRRLESVQWSRWAVRARFPFKEVMLRGRAGVPDFDARTRRVFSISSLK